MLDLSKLKALALPEKEIEVEVMGESQTLKIRALDDETAMKIAGIMAGENTKDEDREILVRRMALVNGAPELSADDIDLLISRGASVVTKICAEVSALTREFNESRHLVKGEAEKN